MPAPRISIIMGIYNCANTLGEAIESVLNQTYSDWKMIMCDDASTDSTFEVAQKYCKKYPEKFVLIKNEKNMGLNFTLNHCLEYADGEYIARMDGDDISLPTRFEKEVDFLDNHSEYAIVGVQREYFDENGTFGISSDVEKPKEVDLVKDTPFCHPTCMVRAEAYQAVNGYTVSKKLLRVEDYELWVKMYAMGYKGYNMSDVLYRMRDDRNAVKRRKFRYRMNEAFVRYLAIKRLNLKKRYAVYILRPIIVGLLPLNIYERLHKSKMSGKWRKK